MAICSKMRLWLLPVCFRASLSRRQQNVFAVNCIFSFERSASRKSNFIHHGCPSPNDPGSFLVFEGMLDESLSQKSQVAVQESYFCGKLLSKIEVV